MCLVSGANAASMIVFTNTSADDGGTGFGNVINVLSLQGADRAGLAKRSQGLN
jgi:hypothetical protein